MTQQLSRQQKPSTAVNGVPLQPTSDNRFGWVRICIAISMSAAISMIFLSIGIGLLITEKARVQRDHNNRQQILLDNARAYQLTDRFDACLSEATQIEAKSGLFPEAQRLVKGCQQSLVDQQIEIARQLAARGEPKKAISLIMQVPNAATNLQLQELVNHLCRQMYDTAWTYYREPKDQFNEAIAVLHAIPENSALAADAQAAIQQMQTEWLGNEHHFKAAQAALQKGDLVTARAEAELVTDHAFWQQQLRPFLQTLEYQEQEQHYATILQAAEAALENNEYQNAVELVQQLPNSLPWAERKAKLIMQADAEQQRLKVCQAILAWLVDCY